MKKRFTNEYNFQIVVALLKEYGIRKIVASPGSTNIPFVSAVQQDHFFEVYSSVDERSAAYIACGLAAESGEAVVLTCTGATASRNYMPALTEAYYRHLPVLAITAGIAGYPGMLIPQIIDRSSLPRDIAKISVNLPQIHSLQEKFECNIKVNQAISELFRNGGGPAHINIVSDYANDEFSTLLIPSSRKITRLTYKDTFPDIPQGRIGIFVGSHLRWTAELTKAVERFCEIYNAAVFSDHTGNYHGNGRVISSLLCSQQSRIKELSPDVVIHLGMVSGDYQTSGFMHGVQCWRVSPDGDMADTFKRLKYVFAMDEIDFFSHYTANNNAEANLSYSRKCNEFIASLRKKMSEVNIPFSNIWIASQTAHKIPQNSVVHFGILNSLRSWNLFDLPSGTECYCNTGGFGIDGCLSTVIGGALAQPDKLHFCIVGDLAFFYDLNALGNRHVGKNLRILLVNNGKGSEFRLYSHTANQIMGDNADKFIAAAGHYGNKSCKLIKHYAEDLGFSYLSAKNKEEFSACYEEFFDPLINKSMILEVFTESRDESEVLYKARHLYVTRKGILAETAKSVLGKRGTKIIKRLLKK